jgi:phosphoribosylformylglycinamidine synthase subunit PurS
VADPKESKHTSVDVRVELKPGVLDAEAEGVQKALGLLGISGVSHVSLARVYHLEFADADPKEARRRAELAVERLLANPVIHRVDIHPGGARGAA